MISKAPVLTPAAIRPTISAGPVPGAGSADEERERAERERDLRKRVEIAVEFGAALEDLAGYTHLIAYAQLQQDESEAVPRITGPRFPPDLLVRLTPEAHLKRAHQKLLNLEPILLAEPQGPDGPAAGGTKPGPPLGPGGMATGRTKPSVAPGPGGNGVPQGPRGAKPEETKPEEAKPGGTKPGGTKPGGTEPAETKPEETAAEGAAVGATKPDGTTADGTLPGETKPGVAPGSDGSGVPQGPDGTLPGETKPGETVAGGKKPGGPPGFGGARPGGTKPGGTKPAATEQQQLRPSRELKIDQRVRALLNRNGRCDNGSRDDEYPLSSLNGLYEMICRWNERIVERLVDSPTVLSGYRVGKALSFTQWQIRRVDGNWNQADGNSPADPWNEAFGKQRIDEIQRHLNALSTVLDAHAVAAVVTSLGYWRNALLYLTPLKEPSSARSRWRNALRRLASIGEPSSAQARWTQPSSYKEQTIELPRGDHKELMAALEEQFDNWLDVLTGQRPPESFPVAGIVTSLTKKVAANLWARLFRSFIPIVLILVIIGALIAAGFLVYNIFFDGPGTTGQRCWGA